MNPGSPEGLLVSGPIWKEAPYGAQFTYLSTLDKIGEKARMPGTYKGAVQNCAIIAILPRLSTPSSPVPLPLWQSA